MELLRFSGVVLQHCTLRSLVIQCRGFKHGFQPKIPKRRKRGLGPGVYAGQISNYDTNDVDWFPIEVPNIPLTPEGTAYQPSKLLAVWQIKGVTGQPYWIKEIMQKHLKFGERNFGPTVVKNTPMMNERLWFVKHLVQIKPVTFPNGIPTEEDLGAAILKKTGELMIAKRLKVDLQQLEKPEADTKNMDGETLKKHLRLRWLNAYHC